MTQDTMSLFAKTVPYYFQSRVSYNVAVDLIQQEISQCFQHKTSLQMLDLGCGVGLQAIMFAEGGHFVTGIDLSPSLLEIFKSRLKECNSHVQQRLKFGIGDWYTSHEFWHRPQYYDCLYSLGNALTMTASRDNFELLFGNASQVLKPGGLFAFDLSRFLDSDQNKPLEWSEPFATDKPGESFQRVTTAKPTTPECKIVTLHIKWNNGERIETEDYPVYIIPNDLVKELCQIHGFSIMRYEDLDDKCEANEASNRVLWVLKKDESSIL